jgi:hypothetical protein
MQPRAQDCIRQRDCSSLCRRFGTADRHSPCGSWRGRRNFGCRHRSCCGRGCALALALAPCTCTPSSQEAKLQPNSCHVTSVRIAVTTSRIEFSGLCAIADLRGAKHHHARAAHATERPLGCGSWDGRPKQQKQPQQQKQQSSSEHCSMAESEAAKMLAGDKEEAPSHRQRHARYEVMHGLSASLGCGDGVYHLCAARPASRVRHSETFFVAF